MALTTPILLNVPAFDGLHDFTFTFNVVGGSQVVANKLVVRRNDTNDIVYQNKINGFEYRHTVPANTLENNVYYNAVITTFDASNNESQPSSAIQFYCFLTPTLSFINLPTGNLVNSSSLNAQISYEQENGEKINSYKIELFSNDSADSFLTGSGLKYVSDGTPPVIGEHLFINLENNARYYLKAFARTIYDTDVETDFVEINVSYIKPAYFSTIELKNNCEQGCIQVTSNIKLINGTSNPSPPTYIAGHEVNATGPGFYVDFNDGYSIPDDFTAKLWFRTPTVNKTIVTFSNTSGDTIAVNYRQGYEHESGTTMKSYMDVTVHNNTLNYSYYIYSNYITTLSDSQYYVCWIRKSDDIYQVELHNM